MLIFPSGKRRLMEAQSTLGMGGDWGATGLNTPGQPAEPAAIPETAPLASELPGAVPPAQPAQEAPAPQADQAAKSVAPDLNEYIFEKLEGFGYPPRRLEEYADEFIKEDMFPGGNREVKITLPDRYYGQRTRLSDKDIKQIISEIQERFQLSMILASRKEKKVVIDFTSQAAPTAAEEQASGKGDDLEEIFGEKKQKSKLGMRAKPAKPKKEAQTMNEMLKLSHNDLLQQILRIAEKTSKETE